VSWRRAILKLMQLGLPFAAAPQPQPGRTGPREEESTPPTGGRKAAPDAGSRGSPAGTVQFRYVRNRRARRYVLRMTPDGHVRVTIPRGGSRKEADAFAGRQRDWIERQRQRIAAPAFSTDERRALRRRALAELPPRLLELAAQHGVTVNGVSIRNQRTRWGSCSADGRISLNWRLVVMPDTVRDYVLIHELMHRKRLDHSAEYWALVAAACPDFQAARQWLKKHGAALR
jgi:predicted metal-dependent hydrolase